MIPYNTDAEQGILSCMMLGGKDTVSRFLSEFKSGVNLFYDQKCKIIAQAIFKQYSQNNPTDAGSIYMVFSKVEKDQISLLDLQEIENMSPSHHNYSAYSTPLEEAWLQRTLYLLTSEVSSQLTLNNAKGDDFLVRIEQATKKIRELKTASKGRTISEITRSTIDEIQAAYEARGALSGLDCGIQQLNLMCNGLQPEMILIAARPSQGKTALALNMVHNMSILRSYNCAFFSLEMSAELLNKRLMAIHSEVDLSQVTSGRLHDEQLKKLIDAAGRISHSGINIYEKPTANYSDIYQYLQNLHKQNKLDYAVIDYFSLIQINNKRKKLEALDELSAQVKQLTREFKIPVILICQLNRDIEHGSSRRPRMSDLKDCGSLEQDADIIIQLWYEQTEEESTKEYEPVKICVNKNRNGPTGDISTHFYKQFTKFNEITFGMGNEF